MLDEVVLMLTEVSESQNMFPDPPGTNFKNVNGILQDK